MTYAAINNTVLVIMSRVRATPDADAETIVHDVFCDEIAGLVTGTDPYAVLLICKTTRGRRGYQFLTRDEWIALKRYYQARPSEPFQYVRDDCIARHLYTYGDLMENGELEVFEYDRSPVQFILAAHLSDDIGEEWDMRQRLPDDTAKRTVAETADEPVPMSPGKRMT